MGTILILYSRGARFDFKNWEIVQTGGIYLKTEPADVEIQIDGEPVKNKSGLLQSGTLINNLKPGTYKIFIQAQDYHSWEKEIRVASSTVAVFDGIILFPKKEAELAASPTDKFLLELEGGTVSDSRLAELSSLFNQLKERQLRLPVPALINKVLPYPYNDRKFIIMTDRALYALDTEKSMVSQVSPRAKDFTFAGNEVFWFEDKGLFSFNLILRSQSQIHLPQELKVTEWNKIVFSPSGEIAAILKKNNELIIWNRSTNKITSLGRGITRFVFSPDSKKIAFAAEAGSLSVYGVKDGAQEEKYILEGVFSPWTGIAGFSWHEDNNYLFVEDRQHKLYFVEVNDYPPINVVEAATQIKNFTYSKDDGSLYWEDAQGIWRVKL
ncbi:MAG: hypothetical protein WD889_01655 [Candidatus Colwellbacteria bacterium]